MEPNRDQQESPRPSLWPIGFAIGVVCFLVGLVLTRWIVAGVGAAITVVCAVFWIRDASRPYTTPVEVEPERRPAPPAGAPARGDGAVAVADEEVVSRYPRNVFLEGATLGLGAVIGGLITVPIVGAMGAPAYVKQHPEDVDLGLISNFPEGQYVIATFLRNPPQGEVSRRSAYIRNNGIANGVPSFTIISNRCAHLGCPVQPNGPLLENQKKTVKTTVKTDGASVTLPVDLIPMIPAGGFGCPCHGGQYDQEGNRTSGPPVRGLDRYSYEIRNSHLVLVGSYSVDHVDGTGATAKIHAYDLHGPGQHVTGPESWFYPLQPPS